MDYKFWIPVLGTFVQIAIGLWSVKLQIQTRQEVKTRAEKRRDEKLPWYRVYWPILAMGACMVGTWIPYFSLQGIIIPPLYLTGWGPLYSGHSGIVPIDQLKAAKEIVDGRLLISESKRSRLAGVCFHYSGLGDRDDVADLQKSQLYDIRNEDILIVIPFGPKFMEEMKFGDRGTTYKLLLVPNSISMNQFSTLHEASRLGVKVIGQGGGPP
jgi:hypothetical protein